MGADVEGNEFENAVSYVQNLKPAGKIQPSNTAKLMFYALYKQAVDGQNKTSAPSRLKVVDRAKWTAWSKLGNMSKNDAKSRYIAELAKVDPNWKSNSQPKSKL
uniref:ACB domain-containing protein n=1 Tax=Spongospora subterranea TaxID=70186 RepID=A0A0H5R617_9EUKA|eukprot:CRZ09573.1 hypothetical protein [Spongospora subterranea]